MEIITEQISRFWIPILFIILSIPLILKKIPPNHAYGLRTKETLSNKPLWYKVNSLLGWYILIDGILLIVFKILEIYVGIIHIKFEAIVFIVIIISLIVLIIHARKIEV